MGCSPLHMAQRGGPNCGHACTVCPGTWHMTHVTGPRGLGSADLSLCASLAALRWMALCTADGPKEPLPRGSAADRLNLRSRWSTSGDGLLELLGAL